MAEAKICVVDGCGKPRYSGEYCGPHAARLKRHGDPLAGGPLRERQQGPCKVDGCSSGARQRGFCKKHYLRFWRHGDPSVVLNPIGERPKTCCVVGCDERHHAHGYCSNHASRYRSHGDPLGGGPAKARRGAPLRWLLDHVAHDGAECLIWPFGRDAYTSVRLGEKSASAHRIMCTLANGAPPSANHVAAHSCGRGDVGCVSPKHLRWATYAENEADKIGHGTRLRGEAVPGAKLTEHDVREIRRMAGQAKQKDLADLYGVDQGNISAIQRRKTWAWLE